MESGYCYELPSGRDWITSPSFAWDTEAYTPTGEEEMVGAVWIDDVDCYVFRCPDGVFRAQMQQNVMAASR